MPPTTSASSPFGGRGLTARRRKISKACDFCREHRVRCESTTPCPPCVANNVACHRSGPAVTPQKRKQTESSDRCDRIEQQPEQPPEGAHPPSLNGRPINHSSHTAEETSILTPSPEDNLAFTSHKTDSTLGFIARINVFCSELAQSPNPEADQAPPPSDLFAERIAPVPPRLGDLAETYAAECDLTFAQTEHLLQIFWIRIHPQMPVLDKRNLTSNEMALPGSPKSALRDAVIAYSLQYIVQSGLHNRLVNLKWLKSQRYDKIAMSYFRRSLTAVTEIATFAKPSVDVMQCYCYLLSYLLDTGEHQAAYNMVGLALRISQTLNYMDERTGRYRECQPFRRIWWTLIDLDFRCSRHIGKPVTSNVQELLCMQPTQESNDAHLANGLLFSTYSIRLTAAALQVTEAMDQSKSLRKESNSPDIETRAQDLSRNSRIYLDDWLDELPKRYRPLINSNAFPPLEVSGVHISDPGIDIEELEEDACQSEMEILLHTLLILQYHNAMMSLHRVFIQFPSQRDPRHPKSTPEATLHTETALDHATRMIGIAHKRMAMHEIFYGHSEFYGYMWNAVITITGYMLAYPYSSRFHRAKATLDLALELFELIDGENVIASRAATLTRHLMSKINTLLQNLNIRHPGVYPDLPGFQGPMIQPPQSPSVISSSHLPSDSSMPQGINAEPSWSWADFIDMGAWESYCDEVNEVFN